MFLLGHFDISSVLLTTGWRSASLWRCSAAPVPVPHCTGLVWSGTWPLPPAWRQSRWIACLQIHRLWRSSRFRDSPTLQMLWLNFVIISSWVADSHSDCRLYGSQSVITVLCLASVRAVQGLIAASVVNSRLRLHHQDFLVRRFPS